MLVAQTGTGLSPFTKVATILGKGGNIILLNVGIGIGNGSLVNPVGVITFHKTHLGSCIQRALPDGIRQHQFGSIQSAVGTRLTEHKVVLNLALLHILAIGIGAALHKVEVKVDTQLTHLTVIIGISKNAQRFAFFAGLVRVQMVYLHIIFYHILIVNHLVGTAFGAVCQVYARTHRVVLVQLPVHTSAIVQLVVLPRHGVRTMLQECLQVGHGLILYRTVLAVVLMVEIYLSEHIYPILAIVGTQLYLWTVEIVTQVALIR